MDVNVLKTKRLVTPVLMAYPNVVGVGIGRKNGDGTECVTAMVSDKLPVAALSKNSVLPKKIGNVPIDVIQVGRIQANQLRTDRWRPIPGGVSIGHYKITAGTLGTMVRDIKTGQRLILSNNHVLANSNSGQINDPILQPGPYDGGQVENDTVATLLNYYPIFFGGSTLPSCPWAELYATVGNKIAKALNSRWRVETKALASADPTNYIDAALALPVNDELFENKIIDVGEPSGISLATIGLDVSKSGRTTETTHGNITLIHATIQVSYGNAGTAVFEDQIVSGFMSQGGDSGSLLVTRYGDVRAVGLLFAGSDQATIYNPIERVLKTLEVEI